MITAKIAGIAGGAASIAAVAAVAGIAAVRRRVVPVAADSGRREDFEAMDADRGCVVATGDGVPLAVREVGPVTAPVTVVFVHGYCLRMQCWHYQRRELARRWGDDVRMVFYDQRGHGRSGDVSPDECDIGRLGVDLADVIRSVVPNGPLVLVGHSMGGMAVLAACRQFPESIAERVVGVGLMSTTAAGLAHSGLGRNLQNPAVDAFRTIVRTAPGAVQVGRGVVRSIIAPVLRAASFGTEVSPALVAFAEQMTHDTSVVTMVNFLKALELHDELDALPAIADVAALVLCGDDDWVIPYDKSLELADLLPHAEMVRVRRAGHLVQLEFPDEVNDAVDRLVQRATDGQIQARPTRRTVG
ncbi:alpha/beta hydrolase [Rhodococcus sp. Leaf7]|uniref:alpha/beta fold hydrolase n=1 Tax=unclassified Rhodococcus (in: high G+C Gram-positive bacteria) TaxID=192944 RepID=UPI0006F76337|nr:MULTISPECIES: alpha/beta hydrolase [unclassified Rhodococcus (in: high G+C Gram-positive bacteria)]KQU06421.1 alpha/beta hydrolase [Rhodococcus sp. Leaf7]KQU41939.1 alpha/beta hydrolase [Rhodococcus sp. Leaf247]